MLLMDLRVEVGVCFEKKMPDLLLFTDCPDQQLYFSRISEMVEASFLVAFEKSMMSSAYIKCVIVSPLILVLMPQMFLFLSSRSSILERISWPKMNK